MPFTTHTQVLNKWPIACSRRLILDLPYTCSGASWILYKIGRQNLCSIQYTLNFRWNGVWNVLSVTWSECVCVTVQVYICERRESKNARHDLRRKRKEKKTFLKTVQWSRCRRRRSHRLHLTYIDIYRATAVNNQWPDERPCIRVCSMIWWFLQTSSEEEAKQNKQTHIKIIAESFRVVFHHIQSLIGAPRDAVLKTFQSWLLVAVVPTFCLNHFYLIFSNII